MNNRPWSFLKRKNYTKSVSHWPFALLNKFLRNNYWISSSLLLGCVIKFLINIINAWSVNGHVSIETGIFFFFTDHHLKISLTNVKLCLQTIFIVQLYVILLTILMNVLLQPSGSMISQKKSGLEEQKIQYLSVQSF